MKSWSIILLILLVSGLFRAQSYTSYFTGDIADVEATTTFGVVLMGGASEHDEAMKWFLERAGGGDVVVIRASGSDGYNNYMFSGLGVDVNSVETIVFNNAAAAWNPYVVEQVENAEAIWLAGGDQWDYVSYWKGTAIDDAINHLLNVKQGPVGGTSAGMAVMGGAYFSALNGTTYSEECLNDPYNEDVELGFNDFVHAPFLPQVITDTHYNDPDRRGRHVTFMARLNSDEGIYPLGIACDEYTAICIDEYGIAFGYGEYPAYDEYVYFIRPNCPDPWQPEICEPGSALSWNRGGQALKVYRIGATLSGEKFFDLNDWTEGSGGEWQDWWVADGEINFTESAEAPGCSVGLDHSPIVNDPLVVYPIPSFGDVNVIWRGSQSTAVVSLINSFGSEVYSGSIQPGSSTLNLDFLAEGVYFLKVMGQNQWHSKAFVLLD
jgi:cyanophycinase-like exopeptidase